MLMARPQVQRGMLVCRNVGKPWLSNDPEAATLLQKWAHDYGPKVQQQQQSTTLATRAPPGHLDAVFSKGDKMGIRWSWGNGAQVTCVQAANDHAAVLGVAAGDILISTNGKPVAQNIASSQFRSLIMGLRRPATLRFRTTERFSTPAVEAAVAAAPVGYSDVVFAESGKMGIRWGLQGTDFTRVQAVATDGYASRIGVRAGDVAVRVNQTEVPADIDRALFQSLILAMGRPATMRFRTTERSDDEPNGCSISAGAKAVRGGLHGGAGAVREGLHGGAGAVREGVQGFAQLMHGVGSGVKAGAVAGMAYGMERGDELLDAITITGGAVGYSDVLFVEGGKFGINWHPSQITRVDSVAADGYAARLGVSAGDIIVSVNKQAVSPAISIPNFQSLITGLPRPCTLRFNTIKRGTNPSADRDVAYTPVRAPAPPPTPTTDAYNGAPTTSSSSSWSTPSAPAPRTSFPLGPPAFEWRPEPKSSLVSSMSTPGSAAPCPPSRTI
jgi:membrane-associated protease RseP (regulator of RpoE activity)